MSKWITLGVSFMSDFLITAGSTLGGAMVATSGGPVSVPSKGVWILALITGLVAAARRVQALLQTPPSSPAPAPGS